MIEKIISGGQTWPEIAALDLAIQRGIPYTGWRPNIQVPSPTARLEKYQLHTHPSNDPRDAVSRNVAASDGTFILSSGGGLHGLADHARKMTLTYRKQILGLALEQHSPNQAAQLLAAWIQMHHVKSLFATGPSAQRDARTYFQSLRILESAISTLTARLPADVPGNLVGGHGRAAGKGQPPTVADAVEHLASALSLREKTDIAAAKLDDLLRPGAPLLRRIRGMFNLEDGDAPLFKSCQEFSGGRSVTPREASRIILKALWKHLQQTHRLRVIRP